MFAAIESGTARTPWGFDQTTGAASYLGNNDEQRISGGWDCDKAPSSRPPRASRRPRSPRLTRRRERPSSLLLLLLLRLRLRAQSVT
jgi:hypothetical protein|eukprot:31566-Pelagococcus_subviridis.AAC.3